MEEENLAKSEGERLPYGEGRRIRYYFLICRETLGSEGTVDQALFYERVVSASLRINPLLRTHLRRTGVLEKISVARNYVRYCNWLNLVRIESRFVVPNGYTVFLSNLTRGKGFQLSRDEKLGFFFRAVEKHEFRGLLMELEPSSKVKRYKLEGMSEHFVETFFEWFVDLEILMPLARRFGNFVLTSVGKDAKEAAGLQGPISGLSSAYASAILGRKVVVGGPVSDDQLSHWIGTSIAKNGADTKSQLDSKLHSALPHILDVQLRAVKEDGKLLEIQDIIGRLQQLSDKGKLLFNWDSLSYSGYVKLHSGTDRE
jgi:hypothetical protein